MTSTLLRGLVLDDKAQAKADKIREYAEAHHYIVGKTGTPGDDPHFVGYFNSYRVVFSITESDGATWRHLSCSVPGGKYPNPIAVFNLCALFGFTGYNGKSDVPPPGWLGNMGNNPPHIIIAQRLGADH